VKVHLAQLPYLHTTLMHRHGEIGDALLLRHAGISSG
jgi:hypothetical protein